MRQLRTALMGLAGEGGDYLAALLADDQFELVAVADSKSERRQRVSDGGMLPIYDDYRRLIVETTKRGLDALVVTLRPSASFRYLPMAAEHGLAVFHRAPPARCVREAKTLVETFDRCGRPLVVSRPWVCEPAWAGLRNIETLLGRPHAATALIRRAGDAAGKDRDGGRTEAGVASGQAYHAVDLLVRTLGTPETVYCQCTADGAGSGGGGALLDEKRGVFVTCRFAGGAIGCVAVVRGTGEPGDLIVLAGERGTLELSGREMRFVLRGDSRVERRPARSGGPAACALGAFGASLRAGLSGIGSRLEEHLATIAVIETAGLSATTGVAESPQRLLEA